MRSTSVVRLALQWVKVMGAGALLVVTGTAADAKAQDTSLARVQVLGLQKRTGAIEYHHSAGAEERAAQIAALLAEAQSFFRGQLGLEAWVRLAVLNEADWRQINPQGPYGIPYVSGSPNVIFMPATDDNVITASMLAQEKTAPATLLQALERNERSFADWSRTSVDLIALHELGHAYVDRYRINPGNKWFNEFLASYHAYSFLAAKHPAIAQLWRTATAAQIAGPAPKHTSLEDFERLYDAVGPQNYGWYQALFLQKVAEIHDRHGLRFIPLVHWTFPRLAPTGDWLAAFLKAQEPLETVTTRLEAIDREFRVWPAFEHRNSNTEGSGRNMSETSQ